MKNDITKNIHPLELSIPNVIMRFYLMMAIVIGFGFAGYFLLGAVIAFVFAFSTIVGLSFKRSNTERKETVVRRKAEFVERTQNNQIPVAA